MSRGLEGEKSYSSHLRILTPNHLVPVPPSANYLAKNSGCEFRTLANK